MSYPATVYKVMIASPSDVVAERNIIREVLQEWNAVNSEKRKIVLLPVGWETHSSPEMGDTPQSIINEQIATTNDLLVGVFWTRVGTPTDKYMSGSVEEIEEHIKASKIAMLYFSSAPVMPDSVDPEQYAKLKEFKDSCKPRGLFEPYADLNDFKDSFYRHIQLKINQHEYFNTGDSSIETSLVLESEQSLQKLSKEAATLLKDAAQDDGQIIHIRHMSGAMIQTNKISYTDDQTPRTLAIWEGAIDELENLGLIRAANAKREIFRLTREGYEMAEIVNP
ncbi:hypothetical protein OI25_2959 [Paraburkholderia fungorum]|uniref:DUF4062 domain-containing protein n=1 Tax=Paraburkholderia fungorum TaxID=134537 RepID=A0AAU8SXX6_9BURK|nr:hypothetical protein [Paraburkholderia fungorum]AJZ58938.1 hypothetical protein OI25_2959 [Paraburkholderia fungorum]